MQAIIFYKYVLSGDHERHISYSYSNLKQDKNKLDINIYLRAEFIFRISNLLGIFYVL